MTAGAPWSVKGIDPKAREVAKDLARRSGMTLGEWLNRVILEDDMPEEVASEEKMPTAPQRSFSEPRLVSIGPGSRDDLSRVAYALDRLTDRIEASETRTGLAISGVEHSVRQAVARIETNEREHVAIATRFESAVDRVATEQSRLGERLRRMETEPAGPRSSEALRAIEQSVNRIANDTYESEGRVREAITALESRLGRTETLTGGDPTALVDEVVRRLGSRLADAEGRTADALDGLRASLGALDERLQAVEGQPGASDQRLQDLAAELTRQVEAARAEVAEKLRATSAGRVDQRFAQLAAQVETAERRSADAIQQMGREVLGMADALNRRLQASEQRGADAITQVGGEIARIAGAVEQRLGRAEQVQAEALEKLGAEIGRITERLTDRMLSSERRAAQAIDDVGEQVARVTERIEQRHERASEDLAQRIRESEERTARMLEDAGDRLGRRLPGNDEGADQPVTPSAAAFGPELFSRAETAAEDEDLPPMPMAAGFSRLEDEEPLPSAAFAPIPEPEDDIFGLDQPEPPVEDAPRALSTREVIEQARAAARAQTPASAERPARIHAKARANWRTTGRPTAGLFGGLKPRSQNTTLQTALMVAGVAAFMSVGAAGVMLIEGPGTSSAGGLAIGGPTGGSMPRAALALTPQAAPPAAPTGATQAAAPVDAIGEGYANAVRAIEHGQAGGLAKLRALAEAGHAPAQAYLAGLYEDGDAGLAKNPAEARRWMQRAAEGGEPTAMHNLALYEFSGVGGPAEPAAAATWFRKAAEHGVVSSQYNLALLYQSGSGVERDLAQAYKWFAIAAASGDGSAAASALDLRSKLTPVQLVAAERAIEAARGAGAAPAQVVGSSEPRNIATAQRILGRLGYYRGPADGVATPQLKIALSAYQRDQRLPTTGALDAATAAKLAAFTR